MPANFAIGVKVKASDRQAATALGRFTRKARRAGRTVEASWRRVTRASRQLRRAIRGVVAPVAAIGTAAVGAAAGVFKLASGYAAQADQISKNSRKVGLSVQTYQELAHVADLAGVSQQQLSVGLKTFARNLGDLRAGGGELLSFLKRANPGFLKQLQATKDNKEALDLYLGGLASLTDAGKRAKFAAAGLGESGVELTLMLENGVEAFKKQRGEIAKYGLVLSDKAAKDAEDFVAAQSRLKLSIAGVKAEIAQQLLPVMKPMLEALRDWITANRGVIAQNVARAIRRIADAFKAIDWQRVRDDLAWFGRVLRKTWSLIGGFRGAVAVLGTVLLGKVVLAVGVLGKALIGLGAAVVANPILGAVLGLAGAAAIIIMHWEPLKAWFKRFWNAIVVLFENAVERISSLIRDLLRPLKQVQDTIVDAVAIVSPEIGKRIAATRKQARIALNEQQARFGRVRAQAAFTRDVGRSTGEFGLIGALARARDRGELRIIIDSAQPVKVDESKAPKNAKTAIRAPKTGTRKVGR